MFDFASVCLCLCYAYAYICVYYCLRFYYDWYCEYGRLVLFQFSFSVRVCEIVNVIVYLRVSFFGANGVAIVRVAI